MQRDGQDDNFQLSFQSSVGEQGMSPAVRDFEQGHKEVVKHQQYLCKWISGTKGEDKYLI